MKRILVLGINYAPEMTGIGKYTAEFCEYMVSKGYNVDVITGHPYYPVWANLGKNNSNWFFIDSIADVHVWRCPLFIADPRKTFQRILQEISFFLSSFLVLTLLLIKKPKANLIFVVSPSVLNGLTGIWYKFWNPEATLIYHVQDLQIDAAFELKMISLNKLLYFIKKIELFILKKVDVVSTISDGMVKKIQTKSNYIKKIILFPNWINDKKIFPLKPEHSFYKKYGLPVDKRIVLYSGSIGEKQGLEIILKSAMDLSLIDNNIHFVISSAGPYFNILKQKSIQYNLNNVHFLPLLDSEYYNILLNAAWLHLVIQKELISDCFMPSKIASIVASGGALLATASVNSSVYNLIQQNQFGWTIEPDNDKVLTNKLLNLVAEDILVFNAKMNAIKYARTQLRKESVINTFLSTINFSDTFLDKPILKTY